MRRAVALAALTGLAALAASSATAADQAVEISANQYEPDTVEIDPGDSVTWRWAGPDTNHTVTANPGQSESFESDPGVPTALVDHPRGDTFTHTFAQPGTFTYYCRVHSFMRGTVVVRAPGGGGPSPADTTPPRIGTLRAQPSSFCHRHRRCRQPGTRLTFTLSEAADLRARAIGRDARGRRVVRSFDLGRGDAGRNSIRFLGRRLPVGRYTLGLTATDSAGNDGRARTRIRVVPPPPRRR